MKNRNEDNRLFNKMQVFAKLFEGFHCVNSTLDKKYLVGFKQSVDYSF